MPFSNIDKKVRSKSLSKTLFAATALSASTLMVAAPAHAQFVPDVTITDCGDFVDNPGTADEGLNIAIDIGGTCTVANGDNLELENLEQDDIIIQVRSGTTLINTDTSDEDTIFFQDNGENVLVIEVEDGAELRAANGAIFIEGDENRVVNRGSIVGTGEQEEGLIYVDRDTDGSINAENVIINDVTGSIVAEAGGPAIGVEILLVDGNDDAEDVGVQDAIDQFPFLRIVNREGGVISAAFATDAEGAEISDDNDAINIAGNAGNTGGFDRRCIEVVDGTGAPAPAVTNCHINLNLINSGEISTTATNGGTAGITIEDDAIFNGRISNLATGVIQGARNGIRIGDVAENGGTADHDGFIANRGLITATAADGRGIDLEGDGISIRNFAGATISGLNIGIEVGNGTADVAQNNVITNLGTISGGNSAIDSSAAGAAIRINSIGGTFTGDIIGSAGIQDTLSIQGGVTDLTDDVLGDFDVRVTPTGTLNFVGDRTIEGNLFSQGTLGFDLSNTQTVTGDLALRGNGASTVTITDASGVGAIGETFTLVSVGGTLTQNGAALDTSLLLDFDFVDQGQDLAVEAVAAGTGSTSSIVSSIASNVSFASSNVEAFGETVLTAFVDGGLNNTLAFSDLGSLETSGQLGTAIASLAPDFSGDLVQNVFNTVQNGTAQVDHRLNDLDCNQFAPVASLAGNEVEACHTFAETGHWVQTSQQNSTQGSLSLGGATYFNHGSDTDNVTFTYGYDQAVSDNTVLGFSSSYSETGVNSQSNSVASTELDVLQFTAYAGHRVGNAQFVTKASYSYGEAETNRQSFDVIRSEVDIAGINAQSVASYNVNVGQGYYLKPEVGLHYNNITTSAFTESGGLNLNVDQVNSNVLDGRVGLTLGARKAISEETRADMFVTGAIRNDFYGDRDDIGFNFAGQAGSLAVANTDRFAVQGLAGVNVVSGKTFTFGAAVNSEFSDDQNSVGGSVQTKLRW